MSDEATFSVRLIDKVTGSSKSIDKALGKMSGVFQSTSKAMGKGDIGGRIRRMFMGVKGGTNAARNSIGQFTKGSKGLLDKVFGKGGTARESVGGFWKGVVGGNLATQAINKIGELGMAAVRGTADFVMFGERSRLALSQLGKHNSGEKLFTLAREMAKKYGLEIQGTTENLQKLLAAQFKPKLASDIIKMGADLRSIGSSAEDAKGAVRAISQIKGAGRLQGDELNQLSEAGISRNLVMEQIGKALGGKSTAEVIKLQETGKIDADTAIQGILDAVKVKTGEKALGEAGARWASTTIEGMTARGQAVAGDAMIKITDRITGSLNKLTAGALGKFATFLESPNGEATMTAIGDAIDKVIGIVVKFGGIFGSAFGDSFSTVMKAMGDTFGSVGVNGNMLEQVVRTLGKALGFVAAVGLTFVGIFIGVKGAVLGVQLAIVEGAIGAFDWMIQTIGKTILWFDNFGAKVDALGRTIVEAAIGFKDAALGLGKAFIDGLVDGIYNGVDWVVDAVKHLGDSAIGAFKSVLGINSPSKVMFGFGGFTTDGFTAGIDSGTSAVEASGHSMAQAHVGGLDSGVSSGGGFDFSNSFSGFDAGSMATSSMDVGGGGFDFQGPSLDFGQSFNPFGSSDSASFDQGPEMASFSSPSPAADSATAGTGGTTFAPQITVHVDGAGKDAEQLGSAIGTEVERRIEDFFRQLDMEG